MAPRRSTRNTRAKSEATSKKPEVAQHRNTASRVTKKKAPAEHDANHTASTSKKRGRKPKSAALPLLRLTSATNDSAPDFIVHGDNDKALFTLAVYRGEGMCLLAMNWKQDKPSDDFVGFAIEYQEPGGNKFYAIPNRLSFPSDKGHSVPNAQSSRLSPFQKFRWIHFPYNAGTPGSFTYRVTPVFMDGSNALSYGDSQDVNIELDAETYPGKLNVCNTDLTIAATKRANEETAGADLHQIAFTRGFISSQAFVNRFGTDGGIGDILPTTANAGLDFKPKDEKKEEEALSWMGYEARTVILSALDQAVADETAQVCVAAYDFNDLEIVNRLQKLGNRLKIIIDDSGSHKPETSAESRAARMLVESAGASNVQRQHMGGLQHNKVMIVNGDRVKIAIGGSTNFSWRGIYVQNNNTVVLQGEKAVEIFTAAFDNLWANPNKAGGFDKTASATWTDLQFGDINAQVTFSPHSTSNAALKGIADDIDATKSSLFYSLAFLYETKGVVKNAIENVVAKDGVFVYGLSDKSVGGLDLQLPNGNPPVAFPGYLLKGHVPPPFEEEVTGGSGTRLHHKFVVIDFDKPESARVYTGSYNFSTAADTKNGENLFLIKDQRVAVSFAVEALAMFDHYEFRNREASSKDSNQPIYLKTPPAEGSDDEPWWDKYWTVPEKQHDRELFGI